MSTTEVPVARLVFTPSEMERLLADRPPCWQWAAFMSVVYQCTRRLDERSKAAMDEPVICLTTDPEVALFVRAHLRECDELIRECDRFMRTPAFTEVFGAEGDEDSADPDGIIDAALRLMEFYARHLELHEEIVNCEVPAEHEDLLEDCTELLGTPLRDFGEFMKGVMTRFEELQNRVRAGERSVVLRPVLLRTTTDEALMWSILDRLAVINPRR